MNYHSSKLHPFRDIGLYYLKYLKNMYKSKEFISAWEDWKKHKQERIGSPYTEIAEQRALSALFKESHGIEDLAIKSIDESIANNWAKIYIVKNYGNGNGQTDGGNKQSGYSQNGTSSNRVEALRKW